MCRIRHLASQQHPQIALCLQHGQRLFIRIRGNHNFCKDRRHRFCRLPVQAAVTGDNAAKCADRISGQCVIPGLTQAGGNSHPAGVSMFDNRDCRV